MKKMLYILVFYSILASTLLAGAKGQSPKTLLLVDDTDILYRPGTMRVINQAVRPKNNHLIQEDNPWEECIGYCSVYRNPKTGKYQMWYQTYSSAAPSKTHRVVVGYAESDDGLK